MPKCKHRTLILLGGIMWLLIGIFLLSLGIHLILFSLHHPTIGYLQGNFSVIRLFSHWVSDVHQSVIFILTCALLIGYLKGRYLLAKSVKRQVDRVRGLPNPASLKYLYSKGYYFLILGMMGLGILLRFLPITVDTRGMIDAAIGAALINGATLFFRACRLESVPKKV